ncbi:tRNA uridine-5-carboxymethylaminomethyl(34) synthesis GTPase MnmE [Granulosicoccaceae sp. 1_MG-2023]|nr:tRNA uridine-5-carboxymethylaminomethyl(34) synthesis GTPase MnmE [Granulosicoccaceae sp. 1_MG-2023]
MSVGDTIAAIATPPGRGGVGIVRISGARSQEIARAITGDLPRPRYAHFCPFLDGQGGVLDEGLALYFAGPHSYTGEDVLELQGHGGPVVLDLLLKRALELGCRAARPGEFTERAFLNDKLDLAQAEAVADLIESGSEQAARAAVRSLQGEFSCGIQTLQAQLIELRVYVESALDFTDEDIDFLASDELQTRTRELTAGFRRIFAAARQGSILRDGMKVVIAGEPNVGKSSLLNALTGSDSAIVTDIPGTTRDVLSEQIHIDGMPLHIIDTAGLRESDDPVEQEGIRRAYQQIADADRILMVQASKAPAARPAWAAEQQPVDYVFNKIDLSGDGPAIEQTEEGARIFLSAKTGAGLDLLREHLKKSMGFDSGTEGTFIARRRHLDALTRADEHVALALAHLNNDGAGELCAEELRYAQENLSEITGEFDHEDLLDRIFSSFCIGK